MADRNTKWYRCLVCGLPLSAFLLGVMTNSLSVSVVPPACAGAAERRRFVFLFRDTIKRRGAEL